MHNRHGIKPQRHSAARPEPQMGTERHKRGPLVGFTDMGQENGRLNNKATKEQREGETEKWDSIAAIMHKEHRTKPQRREGRREDTGKKFCFICAILINSTAMVQ